MAAAVAPLPPPHKSGLPAIILILCGEPSTNPFLNSAKVAVCSETNLYWVITRSSSTITPPWSL
jgi:hypothetical protein